MRGARSFYRFAVKARPHRTGKLLVDDQFDQANIIKLVAWVSREINSTSKAAPHGVAERQPKQQQSILHESYLPSQMFGTLAIRITRGWSFLDRQVRHLPMQTKRDNSGPDLVIH